MYPYQEGWGGVECYPLLQVPPVNGGNQEQPSPPTPLPRCGLTARQFFELVPKVGFSLEGQTRGSAPTGKAVE